MRSLVTATATELARRLDAGEVAAREVIDAHLDRIAAVDDSVGAFLEVTADHARARADEIDSRRAAGDDVPATAGVPIAIKDLFCTTGIPTTAASRILAGWRPPYDATVVRKIADAGLVMVGKANMDEFAMGSSTENSAYQPTRNPWNLDRVPGGSSGGSVAAVAGLMAPLAVGTDTGGSIRQPAALTGTVGLKPTYGRVSRYGIVAFASSLDQAGPIARTVEDTALLHQVISGHDPLDSTSIPEPVGDVMARLRDGVDGMRIGVVNELSGEGYEVGVSARFDESLRRFESLGATIVEASLPHAPYGLPAYYLVAPSEASSNLARYDGTLFGIRVDGETSAEMSANTRAAGFGVEVKRRIMIGTYALSAGYFDAYYQQASRVRTLILRDFERAFADVDVLVSPTSPTVAFPLGDKTADPLAMYLNDVATVPASLAGIPALSLPNGVDEAGLPTGLQIMAPTLREDLALRVAWAFEQDLGFSPIPVGHNTVAVP